MTRNLFTAAAAALLASSAFLASLEHAEARGAGRAAGFHRMSNSVRPGTIARGGAVHRGLAARASHVGRVQRGLQVSKALRGGQTMRHGGNLRQLSQRSNPALNRNPLTSRNNLPALNNQAFNRNPLNSRKLPALNNQAGSSLRSNVAQQPQGRTYREMGMGSTPNTQPQANNTPPQNPPPAPQNQNPQNKPQYNPAKELLTNWGNEFINQIPQVALPSATPGTVYSAGGAIKTFVSPPPIEYIKASKNCLQTGVCVRPNPAGLAVTSFIDPRSSTLVNVGVDVLTPDPRLGGKAKLDVGGAAAVQGGAAMVDPIGTVKRQLGGNLPSAWGDLK